MSRGLKVGKNQSSVVKLVGRNFRSLTAAVSSDALNLNPLLLDARLTSLSDGYQEFRFVRVRVQLMSQSTQPYFGLAYTPALLTAGPGSIADLENIEDAAFGNGTFGAPMPRLNLGRQQLTGASPVKWYRRGTAYDDTLESQGTLYTASNVNFSTTSAVQVVEYEIELRGSANTGLTAVRPVLPALDPVQDLELKVSDLQMAVGMAPRVPNPSRRVVTERQDAPPPSPVPTSAQGASKYVLVRRDSAPSTARF